MQQQQDLELLGREAEAALTAKFRSINNAAIQLRTDRAVLTRLTKGLPPHGLRHSCATYLLEIGTPAHVVSSVLRHANVTVTLSIYAHVLRGQKERTAADVDRFLGSG